MNPSRIAMIVAMGLLVASLAGCGKSQAPEPPRGEHQALQRAIQEPIDRARAVEEELQKQQDALQRQIEDSGG